MLDHFRVPDDPIFRATPSELVDARRCTVQLQNGHLYLDAIAGPAQALLGHDAPMPVRLSAAAAIARLDQMTEGYRCVAVTANRDEAVTVAATVARQRYGAGGSVKLVRADDGEPDHDDEPDNDAAGIIALENESIGRSGDWLSSASWSRQPDAIVIGEALSAGPPFAAVLVAKTNAAAHRTDLLVTCDDETLVRVGAVIETVQSEQLLEQAAALDLYLRERLASLQATCTLEGLEFQPLRATVALASAAAGARLKRRMCERGVLVGLDDRGRVVIAPPLVIRPAEIDAIVGALRAALLNRRWQPLVCCPSCAAIAAD